MKNFQKAKNKFNYVNHSAWETSLLVSSIEFVCRIFHSKLRSEIERSFIDENDTFLFTSQSEQIEKANVIELIGPPVVPITFGSPVYYNKIEFIPQ